jgi:hypothetical protein
MDPKADPGVLAISIDVLYDRLTPGVHRDARAIIRRLGNYETLSRNECVLHTSKVWIVPQWFWTN